MKFPDSFCFAGLRSPNRNAPNSNQVSEFPLVANVNSTDIDLYELFREPPPRDQDSGQPHSKRQRTGVMLNQNSTAVKSGSNGVVSAQVKHDLSILSKDIARAIADPANASKPEMDELNSFNASHADAIYQRALGIEDKVQALKWLQCAADLGNARAMCNLGFCYVHGTGVVKNSDRAVSWFQRAADFGNAVAMCNLGACYKNGCGVVQNLERAVSWCQRAADLGNAPAMLYLGFCHADGTGVVKNPELAISWYRRAAAADDSDAMFFLGRCYARGEGVSKDLEKSLFWYQLAADRGCKQAIAKLASFCN